MQNWLLYKTSVLTIHVFTLDGGSAIIYFVGFILYVFCVGQIEQGEISPRLQTEVTDPAIGGLRLISKSRSLDNLGRLECYSCLCKRGPIKDAYFRS